MGIKTTMSFLREIAGHFGKKNQEAKLVEELGELLKELSINIRENTVTENTVSEMADVHILIEQLLEIYGKQEEFNEEVARKIKRTIERIKDGYYEI